MASAYVLYEHIPDDARAVLDDIYERDGVEVWWNSPNQLLIAYLPGWGAVQAPIPRDHPAAALQLANAIADGAFF